MEKILEAVSAFFAWTGSSVAFAQAVRLILPLLAVLILVRCACSLLLGRREPELWGWLILPTGDKLGIHHWENTIGRAKSCDLQIDLPVISRQHAVLTRHDDGSWTLGDIGSRGGVQINGEEISQNAPLQSGDVISLAGLEVEFLPITHEQEVIQASARTRAGQEVHPWFTLLILTIFQLLTMMRLSAALPDEVRITPSFILLCAAMWALFFVTKALRRSGFELECIAFFLSTVGLAVVASSAPGTLYKQLAAMGLGIVIYLAVCWSLRDLERAKKLRYVAAAGGLLLLAVNLVLGRELYGARNWIYIGGISFQPSEIVKICFVFVGASSLERLVTRRNLWLFIAYSATICGCLALMNDFGTAIIFFVAFLVIAFMRSGNFATIGLAVAATGYAGAMVLRFRPYVLNRFAAWRHVWDYALTTGYQQTRSMMCIAAGGLFGLGVGTGWMKYMAASDTDLVFAFVAEEWGLLMSLLLVAALLILAVFVIRAASMERSTFYTIGACAAMGILLTQMLLNVFGTLDILPLTGVTFPFVSNGGSSMLSSWGLLAFLKAADTRQNASFAIRLPKEEAA